MKPGFKSPLTEKLLCHINLQVGLNRSGTAQAALPASNFEEGKPGWAFDAAFGRSNRLREMSHWPGMGDREVEELPYRVPIILLERSSQCRELRFSPRRKRRQFVDTPHRAKLFAVRIAGLHAGHGVTAAKRS
jgi:hypothetical protein